MLPTHVDHHAPLSTILTLVAVVMTLPAAAQTEVKLLAPDAAQDDEYGRSVAVSGDYAIVGARLDDDNGDRSGSAYIYHRQPDGSWALQAKLLASEGAIQDEFGRSVAISGDTAVVGANAHNSRGGNSGAAYVFERTGSTWGTNCAVSGGLTVCNENVLLLASDRAAGANFGAGVAIDGDDLVVGAYLAKTGALNATGAAYVFERAGSNWGTGCVTSGGGLTTCNETLKLLASDAAPSDFLGFDVAVEGGVAVAGAFEDDEAGADAGAAYVFEKTGSGWGTGCVTSGGQTTCNETLKLISSDGATDDQFGRAVAVSGDTIVVGALDDDAGGNSGAAYVFERVGGFWGTSCTASALPICRENLKLLASDGEAGDLFGVSVAVDGDLAVVGAIQNGLFGSTYVFERSGIVWGSGCTASGGLTICTETLELAPGDPTNSFWFGFDINVDVDTVIVGDNRARDNGRDSGTAHIFQLDDDEDDDGVEDDRDLCAGTVIPETVPTVRLNPNHWALIDADWIFDTRVKGGQGTGRSYTTEDTGGCSCAQIIDALGLGAGHRKHGCSNSAMDTWVRSVDPR